MARENSILKLKGKLDGMSFYKTSEGYQVRARGCIEKARILNDANFERTRENMNEFGNINKAGKLIRASIGVFLNRAKDMRASSRLVSVAAQVKNLDVTSARGQRQFAKGLETAEGKQLLEGFEFNKHAPLSMILKASYQLDTATGTLSIPGFHPAEHLVIAEAATHVRLALACAAINAENETRETVYAEQQLIPTTAGPSDLTLVLDHMPELEGTLMFYVLVEFFQEMNGEQYILKSGSHNALQLVKVV